MPTDFMNRRMDLLHSVRHIPNDPANPNINDLTMDTSYPVKLSGKVFKIFKATEVYNTGRWVVANTNNEGILAISADNMYDFAGNVIKNCVGEERLYPTPEDVYKEGDYVVIILDFDNECAKMCSQTMYNYIFSNVGVSDVNLKLFDISGDDSLPGIEIPASQEVFNAAVSFESGDGTFSFMRRNNSDKVLFQAPEYDEDNETYRYVPVADVENKNINGFNISALPLLYPSLTTGYVESFNAVTAMRSLTQLNGKINQKFIDDFCYEWSEIEQLMNQMGEVFNGYGKSFYQNIPEADRNKYLYYIRDNGSAKQFTTVVSKKNTHQAVIPIYKDSLKFSSVEFNGPAVLTSMELNYLYSQVSGYMVGNWWKDGFYPSTSEKSVWSKPVNAKYYNNDPVRIFAFDMSGVSNVIGDEFPIREYVTSVPQILDNGISSYSNANNFNALLTGTRYMMPDPEGPHAYNVFINNPDLLSLSSYVDFFRNDDDDYSDYLASSMLRGPYQEGPYVFRKQDDENTVAPCPIRVAMIHPEYISSYINISSSLYALSDNGNIDRGKLTYSLGNDAYNAAESFMLMYLMSFYPSTVINDSENNLNILRNTNNDIRVYTDNEQTSRRFRFKVTGDYLLRDDIDDQYCAPFGLAIYKNPNNNKVTNYLTTQLTKVMPRCIACNSATNNKLIADMSFVNRMTVDTVKFAKEANTAFDDYLEYVEDNGTYYLMHINYNNGGAPLPTPLYLVKYSNGNYTTVKASYAEVTAALQYNGTVFLYMGDTQKALDDSANTTINRIRYFTDFSKISSYGNHAADPNAAITDIDFFTTSINVFNHNTLTQDEIKDQMYANAIAALRTAITTKAAMLTNLQGMAYTEIVAEVEKEYCLGNGSSYGILRNLNSDNIPSMVLKTHPTLGYNTSTFGLTLNTYRVREYRNSSNMKLSQILPEGTSLYQDGPAPSASRIKDYNGSFITNSSSFIDFISNAFITKQTENIDNNITGTDPIPAVLSEKQLQYVNGVGVREEYYKNKSILEFFNYITTYDVTLPSEKQNDDKISKNVQAIFAKGAFDNVMYNDTFKDFKPGFYINESSIACEASSYFHIPTGKTLKGYDSYSSSAYTNLVGDDDTLYQVVNATITNDRMAVRRGSNQYWIPVGTFVDVYTGFSDSMHNQVRLNAPVSIVSQINIRNNRYGFNEAYIYAGTDTDTQDMTSSYISVDKMYASVEKAGEKEVINLSLADENGILLNLLGILGTLNVDELTWDTLMTALCSNKTVDILSSSLKSVKTELNSNVISATQNVSDTISDADNIDNVADIGTKADFDQDTNMYTYHDGEGFVDNVREMDNRGVLVLISEGGRSVMNDNGTVTTTNPTVKIKRMYISEDGLLCTKEFYDTEKAIGKSLMERLHDLDHLGS